MARPSRSPTRRRRRQSSPSCSPRATSYWSRARSALVSSSSATRSPRKPGPPDGIRIWSRADRRDGLAADVPVLESEVHRIPAQPRVRAEHPRGGSPGPQDKGRHADDGRDHHLRRDRDSVPASVAPRLGGDRGVRGGGRVRAARLRRRLHEDRQAPLARSARAHQTGGDDRDLDWPVVGGHAEGRHRGGGLHPPVRHHDRPRPAVPGMGVPRRRWDDDRGQFHRWARWSRRRLHRDRAARLHRDHVHLRRPARSGAARRMPGRRVHRVSVVQQLPGEHLHGRHRLAGTRGRDRRARDHDPDRGAADPARRDLRDRGPVGGHPGVLVSDVSQARLPDGADPPPFRAPGLVGDEDHPALLDRRGGARGDRLRALPAQYPWLRSAVRSGGADGGPATAMRARPPLPGGPYLVVGLARSGVSAALALRARGGGGVGCGAGAGTDPALARAAGRLSAAGVEVHLDASGDAIAARARTLIKSPGVPANAPVVAAARAGGMPVLGEIELAWRLVGNEFVAVTGTNGKTTTAEWIGHIHREASVPVAVVGNVGTAATSLAGQIAPDATVVCEVSSFQLEDTVAFAPEAAALLNLEPDHLDRHGSYEDYVAAKLRIFANQGPDDIAVIADDLELGGVEGGARRLRFGATKEAAMSLRDGELYWLGRPLLRNSEISLPGEHNRANAMAAATVCPARRIEERAVAPGLGA